MSALFVLTVWCCRIWKIGFHTNLKTSYRNCCKVRRRIPLHTSLEIKATGLTAWLERWPMRELEGIKYVSFTCDSTTMSSSTLCYRNNIPSSNQSKLLIFIRLNCESCVLCLWGQRDPVRRAKMLPSLTPSMSSSQRGLNRDWCSVIGTSPQKKQRA